MSQVLGISEWIKYTSKVVFDKSTFKVSDINRCIKRVCWLISIVGLVTTGLLLSFEDKFGDEAISLCFREVSSNNCRIMRCCATSLFH